MNGIPIRTSPSAPHRLLNIALALCLALGLFAIAGAPSYAQEDDTYTYTVERGDTWDIVSQKTGVSVNRLQEANPDSVRDSGWLLLDEVLTIPFASRGESQTHVVGPGDSWTVIAEEYGVSVELLEAANQDKVRAGMVLYEGDELNIPPAPPEGEAIELSDVEDLLIEPPFGEDSEEADSEAEMDAEADMADAGDEVAGEADAEMDSEMDSESESDAQTMDESDMAADETDADDAEAMDEAADEEEADDEDMTEAEADEVDAEEPAAESDEATTDEEAADETADDAMDESEMAETTDEAADEAAVEEPAMEEPTDEAAEGDAADEGMTEEEPVDETPEAEQPATEEPVTEEPVSDEPIACPETLADYPDTIVALLNTPDGSPETLSAFLESCGSTLEESVTAADVNGDELDELVVVYQNPSEESTFVEIDLVILGQVDDEYQVDYRARAAGEVRLVGIDDINLDGLMDVVWIDTTCGASTCFDTVNVRSWDGSVWSDWTDGTITMAYADIELVDAEEGGQDIQLVGGIYGSVGAGPQRSRTELWSSVDGAPFSLLEKTYSASECLYHTVLDANRALEDTETEGSLDTAKALYEKAVTDDALIKCWVRPNELDELRSFSLLRLALIEAYNGDMDAANVRLSELADAYPESALVGAADTWLAEVESGSTFAEACRAVTSYAEDNPAAWEFLSDYGYTNPSFDPSDLCPSPGPPGEEAETNVEDGATGASPRSDPGEDEDPAASEEEPEADAATADAETGPGMPDCPGSLAAYGDVVADVLSEFDGDADQLAQWMTLCGALTDERGDLLAADLNGDEVDDLIVMPAVITDVGLGPNGAQGAVYVLHSTSTGDFEIVANPDTFGSPTLLDVDDLNDDGQTDIAWTVEGCSTFCVLDSQIMSWNGSEYVPFIQPGSAIAKGSAAFAPVPDEDVGSGEMLVVSGGVSDTPEGGLTVPHEEYWQSIGGQPYRRVVWQYDREAMGSNCMGLRMVEADVALQASDVLGFEPAIELYNEALSPDMEACSIFGLRPDDEFALLRGLAYFRLMQAQALSGDTDGAQANLELMATGMPDGTYTALAQSWLDEFSATGSAIQACGVVEPMLEDSPELWQITDHFGYNHPALAASQICFMPAADG